MRKHQLFTIGVLALSVLFIGSACSKKTINTNTAVVNTNTAVVNTNTDVTPTGGTPVINGSESVNSAPQADTNAATTTASISISDFAFSPATLTVKKGTKVTWTNDDQANHIVVGDGTINSHTLNTGDGYSFTFNAVGTFNFHCSLHPTMTGTVVVTE